MIHASSRYTVLFFHLDHGLQTVEYCQQGKDLSTVQYSMQAPSGVFARQTEQQKTPSLTKPTHNKPGQGSPQRPTAYPRSSTSAYSIVHYMTASTVKIPNGSCVREDQISSTLEMSFIFTHFSISLMGLPALAAGAFAPNLYSSPTFAPGRILICLAWPLQKKEKKEGTEGTKKR